VINSAKNETLFFNKKFDVTLDIFDVALYSIPMLNAEVHIRMGSAGNN